METVRLPFNQYAAAHLRSFEARAETSNSLSRQFEAEIGRPIRAIYLGVYDQSQLVGCARVVPQPLGAVLLDYLQAVPGYSRRQAVETALLHSAQDLAAEHGRPLGVITDRDHLSQWTQLGFQPDRRELLTLPVF